MTSLLDELMTRVKRKMKAEDISPAQLALILDASNKQQAEQWLAGTFKFNGERALKALEWINGEKIFPKAKR